MDLKAESTTLVNLFLVLSGGSQAILFLPTRRIPGAAGEFHYGEKYGRVNSK